MKQNWSKFFTQYTTLLVFGSLLIVGTLMYIDNRDKVTAKTDNLQGLKTITIKKTYKSDSIVHEYNDKDYHFDNEKIISSDDTTNDNIGTLDTTDAADKTENTQPAHSLKVNTTSPTAKHITTKTKKGLNAKNPYAVEYANAIKEYIALSKKAEQLKEDKKRAAGSNRNDIDNKLRKMKPEEVNLTHRLKSAQKKYREWEKNH